ncbi:hypothetical protein DC498_06475 [Terrimonas sp.]|uniref:hypothetical protein n=1 Tax=Terrimonas sp. TaxID=1914338 RepID=UPI000D51B3A4|nr:hypothetical protein [Terrimonas sp.]PVD53007.1 hypothetical protein DC498_06475 [Terrimonas sp.]
MEYRFIIRFRLLLVLMSSFTSFSCGYFDNDKIEYQKRVAQNITIQKQENDNSNNLVFEETNNVSAVILNNCFKIYYDSLDKKIYVETSQNKVDKDYWQIKILNSSAQYVFEAIQKEVITKEVFDEKTKNVLMKWEVNK